MPDSRSDLMQARDELTAHRWWAYRACAPAEADPRVCAVDEATPTAVFDAPDSDIPEAPAVRGQREAAARAVCAQCPILAECRAYALGPEGTSRPRETSGILGGLTAAERERMRDRRTAAETPALVVTGQRRAVLDALAAHLDEGAVAVAAGVDRRTANWQRSRLVTMLGLDPETATRGHLLAAAVARGLLDADAIVPDGPRVAVAIPEQRHAHPGQLSFDFGIAA